MADRGGPSIAVAEKRFDVCVLGDCTFAPDLGERRCELSLLALGFATAVEQRADPTAGGAEHERREVYDEEQRILSMQLCGVAERFAEWAK